MYTTYILMHCVFLQVRHFLFSYFDNKMTHRLTNFNHFDKKFICKICSNIGQFRYSIVSTSQLIGAAGTAILAALVSVGYFRFGNAKNDEKIEPKPTTSTYELDGRKWNLKEYFKKLGGKKQEQVLRFNSPIDNRIRFCQMALDELEIGFVEPEIVVTGTLSIEESLSKLNSILLSSFIRRFLYNWSRKNIDLEDIIGDEKLEGYEEEIKLSLAQLLNASSGSGTKLASNAPLDHLPFILINLIDKYRTESKQIVLWSLRILANFVASSEECAQLIVKSDWLPLLSSMTKSPLYEEERVLGRKILTNVLYALGYEHTYLPPNLYELHRPASSQTTKLDIVLIHGFKGSAFKTWRQRDGKNNARTSMFWPKDWLAMDVKEPIRIIAVDYPSQLFRLLETIESRSKRFLVELEKAGIGERPVVFICHSMGGLLAKQMLLDNDALLSKTLGIFFMATPHLGTPLASHSHFGQYFVQISNDVLFLVPKNELNQKLAERFKTVAARIPLIVTVLECEKTSVHGMKVLLIPFKSGVLDSGVIYHLKENHFFICKPDTKESTVYKIVLNFVNDALRRIKQ